MAFDEFIDLVEEPFKRFVIQIQQVRGHAILAFGFDIPSKSTCC
jgi:hypothetical protein